MKPRYYFRLEVETNDWVETLGKLNDVLQDAFPNAKIDDISINLGNITYEKIQSLSEKAKTEVTE